MNTTPARTGGLAVVLSSSVFAMCEVAFVLLPALVWGVVLWSTTIAGSVEQLPVMAFACLSLFSAALRDSIVAFHLDQPSDSRNRELLVLVTLMGVVLSCVLLTLASLKSLGQLQHLLTFYYSAVGFLLFVGAVILFITKTVLIQRKKHGHYV
jgi:hypothetical protein